LWCHASGERMADIAFAWQMFFLQTRAN